MLESFFAKIAGKFMAKKLDLQEGQPMENKKWYLSKGVWTGIITGVLGIYVAIPGLPAIPEWIFALLGGLGIYSRVTADTKIG